MAFLFLTAVAVVVVVRSILWFRRIRKQRKYGVQNRSVLVNSEKQSQPTDAQLTDAVDYEKTPTAI